MNLGHKSRQDRSYQRMKDEEEEEADFRDDK